MQIGLDFGTTTTVASVFDGQTLRLIPLDPSDATPEVLRSVLLIGRDGELMVGRAAIDHYTASNVGRAVDYAEVYVGTIEMTFDRVGTMIKDVHAIIDQNIQARLFQSLKTALRDPSYTSTDVFGTRWSVEQIVAAFLREVRRRAEAYLGEPISGVMIGRPVHYTDTAAGDELVLARMHRACALAGLPNVAFLEEPVAAAYAFKQQIAEPRSVFVFDFGGGTLDTTVMLLAPGDRPVVLATGGVSIGGDLLDSRIVTGALLPYFGAGATLGPHKRPLPAFILEQLADWQSIAELNRPSTWALVEQAIEAANRPRELRALRALVRQNYGLPLYTAVEQAKRRLSNDPAAAVELAFEDLSFTHDLARIEFERLIGPEIRVIAACVDQTLCDAGARAADIDVAVRTGGSSRIPRCVRLLAERFGAERLHAMDAFTSVGAGLGVAAWEAAQHRAPER